MKEKGFTLVELIVALATLAVIGLGCLALVAIAKALLRYITGS